MARENAGRTRNFAGYRMRSRIGRNRIH